MDFIPHTVTLSAWLLFLTRHSQKSVCFWKHPSSGCQHYTSTRKTSVIGENVVPKTHQTLRQADLTGATMGSRTGSTEFVSQPHLFLAGQPVTVYLMSLSISLPISKVGSLTPSSEDGHED